MSSDTYVIAKPCRYLEEYCKYVENPCLCWTDPYNMIVGERRPDEYCPQITKYLYEAAYDDLCM